MIKTVTALDGVKVTAEARIAGCVRVSLNHDYFQGLGRVQLTPQGATELAWALMSAAKSCEMAELRGPLVAAPSKPDDGQGAVGNWRQGGYINWPWMAVLATGVWVACVGVSWLVGG